MLLTRSGLAMIGLALLAGCASRTSRVEGALVQAGVSGRMASCLAPRLADQLTNDQLRALAKAAKRTPGDTGKVGTGEIVARVAGLGDPEIVRVVSAAGLHCALKL
jgi:hypothetical protein